MTSVPFAVEARNIHKRFGANPVLKDVSLAIPQGTARALVGRNGAGKSTLVGVLTGLLTPESGKVAFQGEVAPSTRVGADWKKRVACVYQRSTLIPTLSVAENLFVNAQPGNGAWVDWSSMRRAAQQVAEEWQLGVDVKTEAARLRVEQRQIVEIARALLQGARFIILDEPTAALEGREVEQLFERLRRLKRDGVSLLYISHHLHEIYELCDSVTVMRDGQVVAEAPLADMPKPAVVAAMVGDEARGNAVPRAAINAAKTSTALRVEALSLGGAFRDVGFEIASGERLGLAGLRGSGKEEIGDVIAGLLQPSAGTVTVAGRPLRFGAVSAARGAGIGYVPRDRRGRGLLPQLSVAENLTAAIQDRLGKAGFIAPHRRNATARQLRDAFGVVCASLAQPVAELSGGNQQKVVMCRALSSAPKVLVLVYPTQGVDVAAKEALFGIIAQAQERGTGVLLISDEADELQGCDRILVVHKGRVVRAFEQDWTERDLVAAMEGV